MKSASSSFANDFLFTGEHWDSDAGLYYLRARYYDPSTGRFISRDPWAGNIANPQSLNRYVYVMNRPTALVDPSGMDPWHDFQQWVGGILNATATPAYAPAEDQCEGNLSSLIAKSEANGTGSALPAIETGVTVLTIASVVVVPESAVAEGGSLVRTYEIGTHAARQMAERGVTESMIRVALSKGQRYWDPKNGVVNYVLKGGFASGKDLLVGQNAWTGKITTVIRSSKISVSRMEPLP